MSANRVRRIAWLLAVTLTACQTTLTPPSPPPPPPPPPSPPPPPTFSGDFRLVEADDWVAKQACNYVIPMDQTVCSWGRLTVTMDQSAVSVRGYDVYLGPGPGGPPLHRDSVTYTAPLRVVDACAIAIDSTGVTPNGRGVLAGDSLHFYGHGSLGDSLSWGYLVVQVQFASPCP